MSMYVAVWRDQEDKYQEKQCKNITVFKAQDDRAARDQFWAVGLTEGVCDADLYLLPEGAFVQQGLNLAASMEPTAWFYDGAPYPRVYSCSSCGARVDRDEVDLDDIFDSHVGKGWAGRCDKCVVRQVGDPKIAAAIERAVAQAKHLRLELANRQKQVDAMWADDTYLRQLEDEHCEEGEDYETTRGDWDDIADDGWDEPTEGDWD